MTIWLAALYSLGILGLIAIIFSLGAGLIIWAVEGEHEVVLLTVTLIACWIVLAICTYIEGGMA
jgi:hypothetical protein